MRLSLLEQVRQTSSTVNEYGIELASPKFAVPKLTDVYAGPFPDHAGYIILILQQRTMAQMISLALITRNPKQPRETFPQKHIEQLITDLKAESVSAESNRPSMKPKKD